MLPTQSMDAQSFRDAVDAHLLATMIEALHREGFRMTPQRRLILKAVANQIGWHVHPKEVYAWVRERDSRVGLATVYRTLHMLEDMSLMQKIQMFTHADSAPSSGNMRHYHMVCLRCGRVSDIYDDLPKKIEQHARKLGFNAVHTRLLLYGVCEDCE